MKKKYLAVVAAWSLVPMLALAQGGPQLGYFTSALASIQSIVSAVVPLLIGVTVVVFFWNVVKFVAGGADEGARAEAKQMMIWSLIAILVMVSLWGIIGLLKSWLSIGNDAKPVFPTVL
jgi:hypothetical protein